VLAGFVLGAFVPMQLYLAQYVTNEVWMAAFASSALYLCLRILLRNDRSTGAHLALGAVLGAALLTVRRSVAVAVLVALPRISSRAASAPRAGCERGRGRTALLAVAGWSYAWPGTWAARYRELGPGDRLPVVAGPLSHGRGLRLASH
jgi:hypothetical protein